MDTSIDQALITEIIQDAKRARQWAAVLFFSAILLQIFHILDLNIAGITIMIVLAGIILITSSMLFYIGSLSIPTNRAEIIARLQKTMEDKNPKRRLWAAQRLVGYAKDANFSKETILGLAVHATRIVKNPPHGHSYGRYVAADHIIFLREIAIAVPMNRHLRREFVSIIRPLKKIEGFPDEVYEVLTDAIAYHPDKGPTQAYLDLERENSVN
ncbi:MAG: hypothetical protein ACW98K_02140 [Candidatus Kariarchaeaceae archaeon]